MNSSFEYTSSLQYRLKAANTELQAFRSGKKYLDMEEQYHKTVRALERRIKELEQELAKSHRDIVSVREKWFEIFEELEKEFNRKLSAANKKAQEMEERALRCHSANYLVPFSSVYSSVLLVSNSVMVKLKCNDSAK